MSTNPSTSSIRDTIESRIKSGALTPRSRGALILEVALAACIALVALVATLITLSFVFYSVYESREAFLLGFGWEGVALFLMLFPWVPVVVSLVLIGVFQWRLSHLIPSYRVPVIPLFAAFVLGAGAVGFMLAPVHSVVWDSIEDRGLPVLNEIYEAVYESKEGYGIYRGNVIEVTGDGVLITRLDGDADGDDLPRLVILPDGSEEISIGDEIFVLGSQDDDVIRAFHLIAFPE